MRPLPPSVRQRIDGGGRDLTLLVLRFGSLGDVLRTLPAVRLVRAALPEARIFWVLDETWRGLLDHHPDLTATLPVPRSRWETLRASPRRWPELAASVLRWRAGLRELNPDVVLDFHGNLRSGLAGWMSGATVRLGYAGHQQKEGNRFLTTHRVGPGPRRISRVERNLELVRALGLPVGALPEGGLTLDRSTREGARELVRGILGGERAYAVLSPGASRSQAFKRPPPKLLDAAARALESHGVETLVVHGPGEEREARRVVEACEGRVHLAPPTDLALLAALLEDARLFVGGDTGPLHLACALGCPVVGIYGPTDPVVNAPWRVRHRVVRPPGVRYTGIKRVDRTRGLGFPGIEPRDVETAVAELVAPGGPPPARVDPDRG